VLLRRCRGSAGSACVSISFERGAHVVRAPAQSASSVMLARRGPCMRAVTREARGRGPGMDHPAAALLRYDSPRPHPHAHAVLGSHAVLGLRCRAAAGASCCARHVLRRQACGWHWPCGAGRTLRGAPWRRRTSGGRTQAGWRRVAARLLSSEDAHVCGGPQNRCAAQQAMNSQILRTYSSCSSAQVAGASRARSARLSSSVRWPGARPSATQNAARGASMLGASHWPMKWRGVSRVPPHPLCGHPRLRMFSPQQRR